MATYKKYATKNGTPIQVQSAIEDGQGRQIDETYVEHNSYDGTLSVGYSDSTGAIKTDYGVELNAGETISGHLDEPFLFRPTAYPFNRDIITIGGQKATVKEVRAYAFVKNQRVKNGNFENSSGWTIRYATNIVFANNTLSLKNTNISAAVDIVRIATPIEVVVNRKYLLLLDYNFDANIGTDIAYATSGGISIPSGSIICDGEWNTLAISQTANNSNSLFELYFRPTASTGNLLQFRNYRLIDLTQWFNNDTTILSKTNETWFVPWFLNNFGKYIPAYSTGEIENTYATQITTNGVNQWDGTNDIRVLPKTQYYCKGSATLTYKDIDGNTIDTATVSDAVFTTPDNCFYVGVSGSGDIQICLHWTEPTIEQTYHPYEKWVFNIDWSAIGTPLGINSQIGDYKDFVNGKNGKVVGSVDLGTLTYSHSTNSGRELFSVAIPGIKVVAVNVVFNAICPLYEATSQASTWTDMQMSGVANGNTVYFVNNSYTDAATFKAAMSGVILQYELAEPTLTDMTESEKLTNTYNVNDYGTELFDNVCALDVLYQNNLVRQIVNNQTAIADHEQRIGALETEVEGITGLPTAPSTNGNYRLRCTVADGVATYTWVEES